MTELIDTAKLVKLLQHSLEVGTERQGVRLAIEWVETAGAEIERLQAIVRRFIPSGLPVFCIDPTGEVTEVYVGEDLTCASAVFDNQSYEAAEIPLQNCYPTRRTAEPGGSDECNPS